MALSSPGIGSNLDVNSIVSQLMAVEQQPLVNLTKKEASYQAKLSAIGNLKGALSSFQSTIKSLSDISKFQGVKVSAADTAIVTASGAAGAAPGTYSLEVSKLAQAQKLASAGQASINSAIGTGTITFEFGTIAGGSFDAATGKYTGASFTGSGSAAKTVTIDSNNLTLSGIRDAINKANIGVTASIVNDGGATPYRLVLTQGASGKENSMKISVSGDAALGALLNHDPAAAPAGQAFSETATAQNAEFKLDGVAISKSKNTITDAIEGVTLNLLKTNAGSPTSVTVARDTSAVTGAVKQFVDAFNEVNKTLKQLSSYDAENKKSSVLTGDSTVRSIQTQLRGVLSSAVAGAGGYTSLSQIGVGMQKDGTLALDSGKLQKAIDSNYTDIAGLFAAAGKSSDSLISYTASSAKTTPGTYAVNISQVATQGRASGQTAAGLAIDASNDTLQVKVDGVDATIKLRQTTYASAAELAAEVQAKINGAAELSAAGVAVKVSESAGGLTITSNRYGSASKVSVIGGNGLANLLGASPPTPVDGVDVAGTINGVPATGSGQTLTAAVGSAADGLKLLVDGGSTGDRGTVNFSKGYAYQFDRLVESLLDSKGTLAARTDGINASIKNITDQKERLSDRLAATEKRYRAQFTALDVAISSMTKTSNYLTQQLANLPSAQ